MDELSAVWPELDGPRLDEIIPRHMSRDGFRFVAEEDERGRLAGIAYGYLGAPGQWWHDIVAREMTEEQRERWLGRGHFEFVELAVRPDLRRRGLGARLHDELLRPHAGRPAVLSTQVEQPARPVALQCARLVCGRSRARLRNRRALPRHGSSSVRHGGESGRMSGGILPAQRIRQAIEEGWIGGDPVDHVQPASLDLRLGAKAYALRCSFLPDDQVSRSRRKLADLAITEFDISGGARSSSATGPT